jgi:hypothetical protein
MEGPELFGGQDHGFSKVSPRTHTVSQCLKAIQVTADRLLNKKNVVQSPNQEAGEIRFQDREIVSFRYPIYS